MLNSSLNWNMSHALTQAMPMRVSFLSPYPDFLSFGIVLLLTGVLAYGVQESAVMNNIFTAVNLLTVITVIIAGLFKVDIKNWQIPKSELPPGKGGEGGFMPFGVAGVMAGAAKCFFGFVGFDCVATTGEEAKNPQRHIPLAIISSLVIIFLAYFGISSVLTLMWPYYAQDADAPLVHVFSEMKMDTIRIMVTGGAVFALCTSLFGCIFPMPRILYAMSVDGLLPKLFSVISEKSKTPVLATILSGILAGIMAAIFNLDQLINMMSIGTLLAYTIVSLCVLLLRYRDPKPPLYTPTEPVRDEGSVKSFFSSLFNTARLQHPDKNTTSTSEMLIGLFVVFSIVSTLLMTVFESDLSEAKIGPIIGLSVVLLITVLCIILLALQPQDTPNLFFKVPLLPTLPCLSIFINIYLMMKLDINTWVRFTVWLAMGAVIYIFYSIPNSVEGQKDRLAKQNEKKIKNSTKM